MIKKPYEFPEGFDVLNWTQFNTMDVFSVFEMACLSLCKHPRLVDDYVSRNKSSKEVFIIRNIISSVVLRLREKIKEDEESTKILKSYDYSLDEDIVLPTQVYWRDSIKDFYLYYFPNEKPYYLFPSENQVQKSQEEILKAEIQSLKQDVKQLSKLVIALAVDGYDYQIPNKKTSVAGLTLLSGALKDSEEKLNKGRIKDNQLDISMSRNTLNKYLIKALEQLGIEVRA